METFHLFVLDGDRGYHLVASVEAEHIDDACDVFFPADPSDKDHSAHEAQYAIDCIEDNETIVSEVGLVLNGHETLTYSVTPRYKPSTRFDLYA